MRGGGRGGCECDMPTGRTGKGGGGVGVGGGGGRRGPLPCRTAVPASTFPLSRFPW